MTNFCYNLHSHFWRLSTYFIANMATRPHPTFPQADVESHNTEKSCYVTLGTKVYDITPFLDDHPGGAELILEHAGKDVQNIMQDEVSHLHSEAAYEILDDHFVGYVATDSYMNTVADSEQPNELVPLPPSAKGMEELNQKSSASSSDPMIEPPKPTYANTGMSSAEDLNRETDNVADYRAHKFLDLNRPLLMQVWYGGFSKDFYLEQVHRPRHYKGGQSAPLFGNFLEPLSKTPWWVVPTIWMPCVAYGTFVAGQGLPNAFQLCAYWITGLCIWTLVEYGMHRCLFHIDKYGNTVTLLLESNTLANPFTAFCRITEPSSPSTSFSTAFTIIFLWTNFDSSCRQHYLLS